MGLSNFFYLVYKNKFMMILAMVIAIVITNKMTAKLPDTYTSKARMATGLVDESQAELLDSKGDPGETKINLQFANLIQSIQLKKILDQVSYQLIIHDLSEKKPFRKPSKMLAGLKKPTLDSMLITYTEKYKARAPLYVFNAYEKKLNELLESMGYDFESLKKKLTIFRTSNSDFIDLEFEADDGLLAAFVLNTLCHEFITYYTAVVKENQLKAVTFLGQLLQAKRDSLNSKTSRLKNYKIENRVLNLNEQAKSLYAQISSYEDKKENLEKDIIAESAAIRSIDSKFNPRSRQYIENSLIKINADIIASKEWAKRITLDYINSNYDPRVRARLDSVNKSITELINNSTDNYILNPLAAKESLVAQKLKLQFQLDLDVYSVNTIANQIEKMKQRFDKLVPHEAVIQNLESEIDIASKEYIEILQKFNQQSLESGLSLRLKQIEIAMPSPPAPSKRTLLSIVSGIVVVVLYIIVLFVVFYMDKTLKVPIELANKTNIPVLGSLPLLEKGIVNFEKIWKGPANKPEFEDFKKLLRSIRFEIEQQMKGDRILAISSMMDSEGKSFLALSLAYANNMAQKKILLVDGNFDSPTITNIAKPEIFLEDFLSGKLLIDKAEAKGGIMVLGNRGGDATLFEISDQKTVTDKFEELFPYFEMIIIDAPSMENLNKAKEWYVCVQKLITVYEANKSIDFEKQLKINYLLTLESKYAGWVMNKTTGRKSRAKELLKFIKSKLNQKKKSNGRKNII